MRVAINRICVPTDFSEAADHAVHYGAALAHQHGAALHLLHILEDVAALVHHPDFTGQGELARAYFNRLEQAETAEAELRLSKDEAASHDTHQFLKTLETGVTEQLSSVGHDWWEGLDVHRSIRFGHPVEEIGKYAQKNAVDLLVMGAHGRSRLTRLLLGSTTERVLRSSPCPVLVVRYPEHLYSVVE